MVIENNEFFPQPGKDPCLLGRDITDEIFKNLPKANLKIASLVSKNWYLHANTNIVWKTVLLNDRTSCYTEADLDEIIGTGKNIRNELILHGIENKINKKLMKLDKLSVPVNSTVAWENTNVISIPVHRAVVSISSANYSLVGRTICAFFGNLFNRMKHRIKEGELEDLMKEHSKYAMK